MLKMMKPCIMNRQFYTKPQQRPQAAEGGTWLAVGRVHHAFWLGQCFDCRQLPTSSNADADTSDQGRCSLQPDLNCTLASTTSLVSRRISRHRWKAFPKRDFLRSLVVSVLTGFKLKL